jgi:hypothetical protein
MFGSFRRGFAALFTFVLSLTSVAASPALPSVGPATPTQLYLPMLAAPGVAPEPPPQQSGGFLIGGTTDWAYNPRLALDRAGGAHLVYYLSGETADGPSPAYYASCAPTAPCADPAAWTSVACASPSISRPSTWR